MKKPKGRNDGHIFEYTKIDELIYIGSDLCKGNFCPVHVTEFGMLGVCVEINLKAEGKETPPDDIDIYAWLPVVDGYPPSQDQLDMGSAIIDQAVKNKQIVYVHCTNGHGRSPTMAASYYIRFKNMSTDEAIKLIENKRKETHIEENQRKALMDFENKWK